MSVGYAIVTGAGNGMGEATVRKLHQLGYVVGLSDINRERIEALQAELGVATFALPTDVTDETSVIEAFGRFDKEAGPASVLICCAGGTRATQDHQPGFLDITLEDWIRTEAVNSRSAFLCTREFLKLRRDRPVERGRVVLTSSTAAFRSARFGAGAAYSASKAAVVAIGRAAAAEAATMGITVNVIAPGGFNTDAYHLTTRAEQMQSQLASIPLQRLGEVEEFAALAAFLVSKEAGYITGATIDLNGGARMP